jgi:hypothetical protein
MRLSLRRGVPGLLAVAALLSVATVQADTYGRHERVRVMSTPPIEVVAKLDSGADHSSLNAVDVKYFLRDGDTWARFTIDNGSVLPGNRVGVERPVIRDVKLRQRGGGVEHRPVVEMELCIGDRLLKAELNLSDRTGYTAPLLIGRSELEKLGSVDASREFTHDAMCKAAGLEDAVPAPTR